MFGLSPLLQNSCIMFAEDLLSVFFLEHRDVCSVSTVFVTCVLCWLLICWLESKEQSTEDLVAKGNVQALGGGDYNQSVWA